MFSLVHAVMFEFMFQDVVYDTIGSIKIVAKEWVVVFCNLSSESIFKMAAILSMC